MIGARQPIDLAAAAAKVRHHAAPAQLLGHRHHAQRVVTARAAFEAMKQHKQLRRAALTIHPIEIDEIAVRRLPALALILDSIIPRQGARVDRL